MADKKQVQDIDSGEVIIAKAKDFWTKYNKPVIGISGSLSTDVEVVHEHGIDAVFSILSRVCSLNEALSDAAVNIRAASRNIAATLKLGHRLW